MRRRKLRPGQRPLWGATPVDTEIEQIRPLPGWVVLKEKFRDREHVVPETDIVLAIARPYIHNTVFGAVTAIHPVTAKELGIEAGDEVAYREYAGGRWVFNGERCLITQAEDILARVTR